MTLSLLVAEAVTELQQLFPPVPLIEQVHRTPLLIFGVLECSLAVAFLALWRAALDYRVFRSLGIFYALVGVEQFLQYFGGFNPLVWSLRAIAVAVLVEAAGEAMDLPRRGWTRLFWPVYVFAGIATWFPSMAFVNDLPPLCSEVLLGILIAQGFRRGNRSDRMVAAAFTVHFTVRLTISNSFQHLTGLKNYFAIGGWQWQYTTCTLTLLGAVTLTILVRDLIHDRNEKQRLAAELAASRAVQQVLISRETPAVPGYRIQSVYKPFGEVGGDFFQILPRPDGSVLIAIGDVSGKGMPAAMMVSLLVGTLHALIEGATSPAQLLEGMNRCIQGRSPGGFTTCLILHAAADGTVTFANAGHIPPYRNGVEVDCENNLPLGLDARTVYVESTLHLKPGDRLTLLTDGVIEARSQSGELFGFERTAAISNQAAEKVAQAAQVFGQEDDITVLTVARMAVTA
jgi:hypothetical protein